MVATYERQGVCKPDCGLCCTFLRLQIPAEYGTNPDIKKWVELHGVKVVTLDGATFAILDQPCSALTEDKKCSLYGTPERPDLCAHWPMTPASLLGVEDECSYSFIALEEVKV